VRVQPGDHLVGRYRVVVQVDDNWGVRGWRARDESLDRDVLLTTCHPNDPRAEPLVQAARSAACLENHHLLRVLDADLDADLGYVVREWIGARTLADALTTGPLPDADAVAIAADVAAALVEAHEQGLSHLCLDPTSVVLGADGTVRVRGIATAQVLRGVAPSSEGPAVDDTRGLGRLLFAMLTGLLPDDHGVGLPRAPQRPDRRPLSPRQVRAGVDADLDTLTARALGVPRSRRQTPYRTPAQVRDALQRLPLAPTAAAAPTVHPAVAALPTPGLGAPLPPALDPDPSAAPTLDEPPAAPTPTRPPVPRSVRLLAVGAIAALVVGGGLLAVQVSQPAASNDPSPSAAAPSIEVVDVRDFDPLGNGTENGEQARNATDADPASTWPTQVYFDPLELQKAGVGLVLDVGPETDVGAVALELVGESSDVSIQLSAPDAATLPTSVEAFEKVARVKEAGESVRLAFDPRATRYVLVWFTRLPPVDGGWQGGVREVEVFP
jgi:hypothetical protein